MFLKSKNKMAFASRLKALFKKDKVYKTTYLSIGVLFIIWMLFFDSHSWVTHQELNTEIEQLEKRKEDLIEKINLDQKAIEQLQNLDSLEKYARENYGHKRENETIFIIED